MREIVPQRKAQANPWLWACVTLGACLAAFVVYDLMSSASSTGALVDVKAKASARENELQRQVDHLKKSLGELDGRLANANLRIQELVTERERRKAADEARNDYPRSTVSAESVKILAGAEKRIAELTAELTRLRKEEATPPKVTEMILKGDAASRKPVLLAEALKAWNEGNLYVAKAKFEAILAIDPKDPGAAEGLGMVIYAINDASVARKASERAAGGR